MALKFKIGQKFEFLGSVGEMYGLTVRQDACGGLTIVNKSNQKMVVYVRSVGPSTLCHWPIAPGGDWIHVHGLHSDDYVVTVKVMTRLMELLELREDISWNTLFITRFLIDIGVLPEFVMEREFKFELTID